MIQADPPTHASATDLVLAPAAPVLRLPARVPLAAPTYPERIVLPWERVAAPLLMLAFVVLWFFTATPPR